jgi:predicted kinase
MALALICGLSFAGKSTFAALLAEELDGHVISLDIINTERGLDGGQGIPQAEWATTDRIAHERVEALLRHDQQVVVDDTGSPRFIRDQWRATAKTSGVPFAIVWIQVTRELQRKRVAANRSHQERLDVTDAVLDEHMASFESPTSENPFVVDALDTHSRSRAVDIADSIRHLTIR